MNRKQASSAIKNSQVMVDGITHNRPHTQYPQSASITVNGKSYPGLPKSLTMDYDRLKQIRAIQYVYIKLLEVKERDPTLKRYFFFLYEPREQRSKFVRRAAPRGSRKKGSWEDEENCGVYDDFGIVSDGSDTEENNDRDGRDRDDDYKRDRSRDNDSRNRGSRRGRSPRRRSRDDREIPSQYEERREERQERREDRREEDRDRNRNRDSDNRREVKFHTYSLPPHHGYSSSGPQGSQIVYLQVPAYPPSSTQSGYPRRSSRSRSRSRSATRNRPRSRSRERVSNRGNARDHRPTYEDRNDRNDRYGSDRGGGGGRFNPSDRSPPRGGGSQQRGGATYRDDRRERDYYRY